MPLMLRHLFLFSGLALLVALGLLARAAWLSTQAPPQPEALQSPASLLDHLVEADGPSASGAAKSTPPTAPLSPQMDWLEALQKLEQAKSAAAGEVLLEFESAEAMRSFLAEARAIGLRVIASRDRFNMARVGFGGRAAMLAELLGKPGQGLKSISPNHLIWVPGIGTSPQPDVHNAGGQAPVGDRALAMVGAVGDRSAWGRGVKVAVLDTGVLNHQSLQGVSTRHQDFVRDGQAWHGHGTAMASLIAGRDPEDPSFGIAPAVELLDARVADAKGVGNTAVVAEGLMWAVEQGAAVINISLGTEGDSPWLQQAIAYAQSRGVLVVAAAGNDRAAALDFPAAYPGVMSVGAVDAQGLQAYFSNSGQGLFIAAPGVSVPSAYDANRRVIGSGTSQATAMVSAAAAVLLSRGVRPEQVASVLASSATPTGAPPNQVGAGILWLGR